LVCWICGLPCSQEGTPCGQCLQNSPLYHQSISAFHYEYPINVWMARYKYHRALELLSLMTHYLIRAIFERQQILKQTSSSTRSLMFFNEMPSLLIPIPLHYKKQAYRAFNQSRLIANLLSKHFNIPVIKNSVHRIKATPPQMRLTAKERQKNVKNIFKITQTLPKNIAIIDDIMTTGETVTSLSQEALKNGAQNIQIWTLARATLQSSIKS
jgi:ComF family protein